MTRLWQPEDGAVLRALREASGLDRAQFSRQATLSIKQLGELEDGGSGAFYSESIKATIGTRLIERLGGSRPPAAATAGAAEGPATAGAAEGPATAGAAESPTAVAPTAAAQPTPAPRAAAPSTPRHRLDPATATRRSGRWPALVLMLSTLAAGAWWWWSTTPGLGAPARALPPPVPASAPGLEGPQEAASAQPEAASAASAASTPAADGTASTVPVAASAAAPSPVDVASTPVSAHCRWSHPDTQVLVSMSQRRPADYVYLEAQRELLVCVMDARGRVTAERVPAGEARTFTGEPVLKVYSAQFAHARWFYQGARLDMPVSGEGVVQLQPYLP